MITELTDRTRKLQNYRSHPAIEEYVIADSKSRKIEIYSKENNKWVYDFYEDDDEIPLNSLGIHFALSEAYIDVEFDMLTEEI